MPDINPPANSGLPNPEENNKKVAEDLLKQGLETLPKAEDTAAAGDALDALAKAAEKKSEEPPLPDKGSGTPPSEKGASTEPTAEQKAEEAAAKANAEVAETLFKDSPALPPNASPKAVESFSAIKIKAAQEISRRETELEKIRKENAELQEKLKTPVPPEVLKELEDHRNWRLKLDVDADPKFKQFDQTVSAAQEFIYAQLKKSPLVTEEILAEIKKHGGPENVQLGKLFEAIKDPTIQRLVEAKVADIELVKYNKDQAIKSAKENIEQYVSERTKHAQAMATHHNVATKQQVDHITKELDWFKEKPVDEKSDAATKAAILEHNVFINDTRNQLAAALQDDSADMRAILLVGMVQLFNLQRTNAVTVKELDAAKKQLAEVTEKWDNIRKASTSRLRESAAPANGLPTKSTPSSEQVNVHSGDALDAIAKQVMEKRAAAGTP